MAAFHTLKIARLANAAEDALSLTFAVPEDLRAAYAFIPGQYLTLKATLDGRELRRTYSICSEPGGETISVGIRRLPGGAFSERVCAGLVEGTELQVMTPEGRFRLGEETDLLLVAAGSGITPMISIARAALARGARVTLVYGNRSTASIMFRAELDALKDRYLERFTLIHLLSREGQDIPLLEGRITGAKLALLARAGALDPAGADGVFLCGPGDMIDDVRAALAELGVDPGRVHSERFTPEGEAASRPAASVRAREAAALGVEVEAILDGNRRRFELSGEDASLIDAAHRQGLELPFSCKGGMCCTCRCRIVEGAAEMATNYSLQPWELEQGFTLACQARPTTPRLVLDFDAA